jgi:hypothetical protein
VKKKKKKKTLSVCRRELGDFWQHRRQQFRAKKKKRKEKKPCPSVGGSLEISGSIDNSGLGQKKKIK